MVKLSLAQGSGSLDLSEFELDSVPEEVCNLIQLEVQDLPFRFCVCRRCH